MIWNLSVRNRSRFNCIWNCHPITLTSSIVALLQVWMSDEEKDKTAPDDPILLLAP